MSATLNYYRITKSLRPQKYRNFSYEIIVIIQRNGPRPLFRLQRSLGTFETRTTPIFGMDCSSIVVALYNRGRADTELAGAFPK